MTAILILSTSALLVDTAARTVAPRAESAAEAVGQNAEGFCSQAAAQGRPV